MSEFLPKPRWRVRWTSRQLAVAITATFLAILVFGAAVLWAVVATLAWMGAPDSVAVIAWAVLTAGTTIWALVAKAPATASEMEYQPWTVYVVRYVMVGNEAVRSTSLRVITGLIFGAPIGCYLIAVGVALVTGIM